jgi:hypothetical protein
VRICRLKANGSSDAGFKRAYAARFSAEAPQFADYGYDTIAIIKECGADTECYRRSRSGVSGQLTFEGHGRK